MFENVLQEKINPNDHYEKAVLWMRHQSVAMHANHSVVLRNYRKS